MIEEAVKVDKGNEAFSFFFSSFFDLTFLVFFLPEKGRNGAYCSTSRFDWHYYQSSYEAYLFLFDGWID